MLKGTESSNLSSSANERMIYQLNWFVYLLICADSTFYCGCTNNLERRLKAHNAGKGARYTRAKLPVKLVVSKGPMGHGDALRLEYAIKRLPRSQKQAALS